MPHTDTIPVSASIASVGKGIRYIGGWAYAYSGTFEATTAEQTALEFTTGNNLFVGKIQLNAFLQLSNVSVRQGAANITFNGEQVALLMAASPNENAPFETSQDLIIPALTEVKVTVIAETDDANNYATVVMTGRVYGAE